MGFLTNLLYVVFFLSALLLIIVILLQEPKGGGLAEAFGGFGAETFGVRERGINKFTATVAGVFLASAVFIHMTAGHGKEPSAFKEEPPPPLPRAATEAPPPEAGGTTTKPG
ncbi:MAG: preprotein translocase subunit SecG [Planctomycetes bacterium]|nr:preprotein translocase subunit SecG [Planctomycetota bacterium]